jgi:hypothetical protein
VQSMPRLKLDSSSSSPTENCTGGDPDTANASAAKTAAPAAAGLTTDSSPASPAPSLTKPGQLQKHLLMRGGSRNLRAHTDEAYNSTSSNLGKGPRIGTII